MKKNNSNGILLSGLVLSIMCAFVIKSIVLGIAVFIAILGFVMYKQRASFIAASAATAYKKGDIEKSFKLYEKIVYLDSCPAMIIIHYAYRLITEDEVDKGMKVLKALDTNKLNSEEQLNYNATNAMGIWQEGNLRRAIEIYQALLNERDSMLIYEILGYLLIEAKEYTRALEFNTKGLELYPNNDRIKSNLATAYYYIGERKDASKIYKVLIEEYATFPEPYYYYGLILEEREKYKGALKYWNMALEQKFASIYTLTEEDVEDKIEEMEEELCL